MTPAAVLASPRLYSLLALTGLAPALLDVPFPPVPCDSAARAPGLFPSAAPIASSTVRNSFFLANLLDRLLMPPSCHNLLADGWCFRGPRRGRDASTARDRPLDDLSSLSMTEWM